MNNQATPRPWRFKIYTEFHIKFTCIESNDGRICKIKHYPHYGDTEANAKLIVKAVNCHDELVSVLNNTEEALKVIADDLCQCEEGRSCNYHRLYSEVKEALIKAGV